MRRNRCARAYFVVVLLDVEPVPEVLDAPEVPDGDVLDDEDVSPEVDGAVLDELSVPDGVVDDELPVVGALIELEPVVDGLVVLLVSVLVDEELDDDGGVDGVELVLELELDGGVTTVLLVSFRSQPASPIASATASALDNMILDFMGNSFQCYGDEQRNLDGDAALPAASTRKFGAMEARRAAAARGVSLRRRRAANAMAVDVEIVPPGSKLFRASLADREEKPNRFRADLTARPGNGLCRTGKQECGRAGACASLPFGARDPQERRLENACR